MAEEKKHGAFLLAVGIWNLFTWSNFAKNLARTAKDPDQYRPKPYYIAHLVLIVINSVLGVVMTVLGFNRLRRH